MGRPHAPPGYRYSAGALRAMSHVAANALKECNVPGCLMPRFHVYRFCAHHRNVVAKYGSPTQRPVLLQDWSVEKDIVEKFLAFHRDKGHGGVHAALRWWEGYFRAATAHEDVPGGKEVRQRVREGIVAWDVLVDTTGLFLFSRFREDKLESGKPLSFALTRAVLRHPRKTGHPGVIRKTIYIPQDVRLAVGQYVRKELGAFMLTVCNAVEAEEVAENERKKVLTQGFEPTSDQKEKQS